MVYIVDDDEIVLWMYQEYLKDQASEIRPFASARDFLASYRPAAAECLVCDLRMPQMGGLGVQRQLAAMGATLPIIFASGHTEVVSVVEAMKVGAFDFLEKPVGRDLLNAKVTEALGYSRELRLAHQRGEAQKARLALLTPKEREIVRHVVEGKTSRQISTEQGISVRTVENHRARIAEKLHVSSTTELLRLFLH